MNNFIMNKIYIPESIRIQNNDKIIVKEHMRSTDSLSIVYHLTNQYPFYPDGYFINNQQEFGTGLYVTNKESVKKWDWGLSGRKYIVIIELMNVNIINEKDFPSNMNMVQFLKSIGFSSNDLKEFIPNGDTFNRNPIDIATKRAWMYYKNIDVIIPFKDAKEGEQMIITNLEKIKIVNQMPIQEFYNL
jgi:hypothetical protein